MSSPLILKDKLALTRDDILTTSMGSFHPSGLWAKTEVLFGHGLIKNPTGKSRLQETLFSIANTVPVGGVSYAMQQIYGIEETQISIPTLYSEEGIGHSDSPAPADSYLVPGGVAYPPYRPGNRVFLFGLGITGTGENDVTKYDVSYREKSINMTKVGPDGLTIRGVMYPFRYTADAMTVAERRMYFGKKKDASTGATAFYLKAFDDTSVIKHIWDTGEEDEDEEELVSPSDVWDPTIGTNGIVTFTESYLTVGTKDLKEYFEHIGESDRTRFNTLALYNGEYVIDEETGEDGDYRDVRMFSKLCIRPEYLDSAKDINIIYRVYGV